MIFDKKWCQELESILELKKDSEIQDIDTVEIDKLEKLLLNDWKVFNENPLFFIEGLKVEKK